jgi:hypothetical protein
MAIDFRLTSYQRELRLESRKWAADNKPPYSPPGQRLLWSVLIYVAVILAAVIALQVFTDFQF